MEPLCLTGFLEEFHHGISPEISVELLVSLGICALIPNFA
jgi:hypothetical protein